eukprot:gnl/TRDRNA2_/TRDRNA2_169902_c0_seq1.p1 gnl/TRDRNA2_/TRDRNA2_169902_c0~~gnl/TRDRNA2_/TRDRNA2_169902_c0_seq1.p1  ORF type:complete len:209 (-),score=0.63 gnl/TRDRNA2_/TRDRNA2_169902_c0_seq1:63-689(-)
MSESKCNDNKEHSLGNSKHNLERKWTMWFDSVDKKTRQSQEIWGTTLQSLYTFETIEEFWCLLNNMVPAGELPDGTDLCCFSKGIQPKWEDPSCITGGEWRYQIDINCAYSIHSINDVWIKTLLACIGEHFDESEKILGLALHLRKDVAKFFLWTKEASNEPLQLSIGKQFHEVLKLSHNMKLSFYSHDELIKFGKHSKEKYIVGETS